LRVQYSKKLAENCRAALKSVMFTDDFVTLIKSVEDENGFIG